MQTARADSGTFLWSAPVPFGGLNADQILTNFPSNYKIAGAMYAANSSLPLVYAPNGSFPLVVTTSLGNITFGESGLSSAMVSGGYYYDIGASTNQTGNANFDACLNAFYEDFTNHFITLSGLVVGQQYQVQLFALDDRSGYSARTANYQDPSNAADVSMTFQMGDNVYILGTFTAANTVQTIQQNLLSSNGPFWYIYGTFNCLVLRTVSWNPPPYFAYQPQNQTNIVGLNASFLGIAAGDSTIPNPTISYQWKAGPSGGPYTNLVEGAKYAGTATTNLTIHTLTSADGNPVYVLVATNGGGSMNSREAVLNVSVQGTPAGIVNGSYAAYALSNNPAGLWMLNETNDPSTGNVLAYDYSGNGKYGLYGANCWDGFYGIQGPQPPTYPGFAPNEPAMQTAQNAKGYVFLPSLNFTNFEVTIALWINPIDNGGYARGLLYWRNVAGYYSGGSYRDGGLGYGNGVAALGYNWNDNSLTYTWNSGLVPVIGSWNFVSLVITPTNGTIYQYYINSGGQAVLLKAVNNVVNYAALTFSGGYINLGDDSYDLAGRVFNGRIAGAAIYNHALTEAQLQQMFAAGVGRSTNFPPAFVTQPASLPAYSGGTVQFSASTSGTQPITNQWQFNGTNLADGGQFLGATSNVLTIFNVTTNNVGAYHLVLSNSVAVTVSSNATLALVPFPPTNLVGHWFGGTASLADTSGYSPTGTHDGYGVAGAGVLTNKYMFTNDVPSGATGVSLWLYATNTAIAISNSSTLDAGYTNTYDGTISNSFSIMFWAKGWPGYSNPWASKYGENGNPPGGWQLRSYNYNNTSDFSIVGAGPTFDLPGSLASNDGQWHHYAGTYDAITGLRILYVDGQVAGTLTGNTNYTLAPECHLVIGGKDYPPGNNFGSYFGGLIYDVRIYTAALTQSQITAVLPPTVTKRVIPGANGGQLVLTWPWGTLLEATNVLGPWTTNPATSPFTNPMTLRADFFKVSNP